MTFDELNKLYVEEHDYRSMPYDEFFGEMEITDEQKEKRKETAEKLEKIFIFLLALTFESRYTDAIASAVKDYTDLAVGTSEAFKSNIPMVVMDAVNVALNHPDDPYYFSIDRAILLAENEANSLWNDAEFAEAVEDGKTTKIWHAIMDKKTRDSHRDVNGVTKPIMEPFEVGDSLMMFPRDESLGAGGEEIVNCRCSAEYW
jgi:hypothetical protein